MVDIPWQWWTFVARLRSLTFKIEHLKNDILKNISEISGWKNSTLSSFIFGSAPRICPILVSSHFYSTPINTKELLDARTIFKLNSWLVRTTIYKTCDIYIHLRNDMKRPIYFHKQWFSSISKPSPHLWVSKGILMASLLLCCHHWAFSRLFQRQIAGSLWGLVGVISPPKQVA